MLGSQKCNCSLLKRPDANIDHTKDARHDNTCSRRSQMALKWLSSMVLKISPSATSFDSDVRTWTSGAGATCLHMSATETPSSTPSPFSRMKFWIALWSAEPSRRCSFAIGVARDLISAADGAAGGRDTSGDDGIFATVCHGDALLYAIALLPNEF